MNISKHSVVSPNEILSDVLTEAMDEGFKDHSRGYYVSLIQQALEELSFDTFFHERTEFFDTPTMDLGIEMPEGAFNLRQIYGVDGPECNLSKSQVIYWKRNYYTSGNGYLARDKGNNSNDPFYPNRGSFNSGKDSTGDSFNVQRRRGSINDSINQLYYYNIQNGIIMLSESSRRFPMIAVTYNGVGAKIGEVPFVPIMFRQAVKQWVLNPVFRIKMANAVGADFNKWQTLYAMNNTSLNKEFTGTWAEAQVRAKSMDTKEREDLKEYIGRSNH